VFTIKAEPQLFCGVLVRSRVNKHHIVSYTRWLTDADNELVPGGMSQIAQERDQFLCMVLTETIEWNIDAQVPVRQVVRQHVWRMLTSLIHNNDIQPAPASSKSFKF